MKRIIQSSEAPAAVGPYSQAVVAGDLLFTSGQVAIDPTTGKLAWEVPLEDVIGPRLVSEKDWYRVDLDYRTQDGGRE